ncbi:hypothetical protein TNCV_2421811 [Trichonephila clavipes]|nr:hypothetical protein TNCV_2421811 [Trichonephila clavipes]
MLGSSSAVVSYANRSRLCQIQAHEIHHGKGPDGCRTIQVTVRFSSVPPRFRGRTSWRPSCQVVTYRTSAPQVRVLSSGWARLTQPFIP